MRIAVSTIGTFHYVHLAIELARAGHDVVLYSGYPRWKLAKRYPLDHERLRVETFPYIQAFYMFRRRMEWGNASGDKRLARFSLRCFDHYVSRRLRPCDALIGQARLSGRTGLKAKELGAYYVCDMGSSHIRTQWSLLDAEYRLRGLTFDAIDQTMIEEEMREYRDADAISVISSFARDSFERERIPRAKIWLNPLGVDLSDFRPETMVRDTGRLEILFVGSIGLRKGVPYLLDAVARLGVPFRLRLAGTKDTDCRDLAARWENLAGVEFLGHQGTPALRRLMNEADVLVLPSIEDGFGMVLLQALACGCPIIASRNSGGPDLVQEGKNGFLVESANTDELAEKLMHVAQLKNQPETRQLCAQSVKAFCGDAGWKQYAARYVDAIAGGIRARAENSGKL